MMLIVYIKESLYKKVRNLMSGSLATGLLGMVVCHIHNYMDYNAAV